MLIPLRSRPFYRLRRIAPRGAALALAAFLGAAELAEAAPPAAAPSAGPQGAGPQGAGSQGAGPHGAGAHGSGAHGAGAHGTSATPSHPGTGVPDDLVASWNKPFAPFHVIGNIYFVGASGVSSFFIQTPAGAILLDGGLPETAPLIEKGIAELGLKLRDVKYLINSHAHFDHAGGLAALKKASGAQLVASKADTHRLRTGAASQPPVNVDRVINDGDTLELGGTTLTAHVTPGHTPGCTTWTTTINDAGKPYRVVFYCSTSVVDRLIDNPTYPTILTDYQTSFPRLRNLPSDIFFAPHPDMFQMASKRERQIAGATPNPFIDPGELRRYVDNSEKQFQEALAEQKAEKKAGGSAAPASPPPKAKPKAPATTPGAGQS